MKKSQVPVFPLVALGLVGVVGIVFLVMATLSGTQKGGAAKGHGKILEGESVVRLMDVKTREDEIRRLVLKNW